jgi:putative sugar O-methyltransferase
MDICHSIFDIYQKYQVANADPLYLPAPYWRPYVRRLAASMDTFCIDNFRSNTIHSKGYSSSDAFQWDPYGLQPSSIKYTLINDILPKVPLIGRLFRYIDHRLNFLAGQAYSLHKLYADLVLTQSLELGIIPPADPLIGNPPRITLDGCAYSLSYIYSLAYYLDLITCFPDSNFKYVAEIGAGFGSFANLFCSLTNPCYYFIFDIYPMNTISYMYLNKVFPGRVGTPDDYLSGSTHRIFVLPAEFLPIVSKNITFDLLVNQASFQEMEPHIVTNYIKACNPMNMYLSSLADGHLPNANGQHRIISFDLLRSIASSLGYSPVSNTPTIIKKANNYCDLSLYKYSGFSLKT